MTDKEFLELEVCLNNCPDKNNQFVKHMIPVKDALWLVNEIKRLRAALLATATRATFDSTIDNPSLDVKF